MRGQEEEIDELKTHLKEAKSQLIQKDNYITSCETQKQSDSVMIGILQREKAQTEKTLKEEEQ